MPQPLEESQPAKRPLHPAQMENLAEGQEKPWTKFRGRNEQRRIDLFWARVKKGGPDECWIWIGCNNGRYGKLSVAGGKEMRAHRFSYELHIGKLANDVKLLHKCDVPLCVNPKHLQPGTQLDNMRDMISKGRLGYRPTGKGTNRKMTAEKVIAARSKFAAGGVTILALAKEYGLNPLNMGLIIRRKTHANLP